MGATLLCELGLFSEKPRATLTAVTTIIPVEGNVTLTCSVNSSSSSGWKYYWYRDEKSSEALTTQDAVFHSNGQISVSQEGLYRCRGGRGNPVYYTEDSQEVHINKTDSCFTRSIQSESHSPGSSTNHGVNQNETHEYNSLHPGADEPRDVTYSLITVHNFGKKRKHHKPEQSAVYSEVKTGAAGNYRSTWSLVIHLPSLATTYDHYTSAELNLIHIEGRSEFSVIPSKPTVTLQPSWTQIYSGETVTVRCEIQGGEGAQWTYEWRAAKLNTPPTSNEYRIIRATESDSGGYSCRGRRDYFFSEWSDIITLTVSYKPKAKLRADNTAVPVGGSVNLTCSVNPSSSSGWKYYWYRDEKSSEALTTQDAVFHSNGQISVSQEGLYRCRGGRGNPVYYTEDSQSVRIGKTVTASNRPVVTLYPNWSEIYRGETITVRCEIHGGDTEWDYEWETNSRIKAPNQNEYRIRSASSSNSGNYRCKGRMKSSQHKTTEWSDSVTLTVSDNKPRPVLTVSPSWLSPGASVTLNCEVEHPSAGWSFYWYKAVPDLSEKSSSYELLPDGSGTAQDSYIIHGQTHTAGYVCRAGRGDPEYHTDHSQPEFVWSADVHSAASLTVSPDRVQHFTSDSVSLTCEGNFTEWRVRKFSEDGRLYSDCRRMTGSTCNINTSKSDTAVYWCESGSGEFSSAVNITVQNDGNGPILVSPVHPVTEGASVSLSCSLRTQKILSNVFFYHNDKLIQNDTRGELKISAVSKSDEGFYKCQYSGRESAQSWMSVKVTVSGADSSSSPVWLMVGLVCGVSLIIILLLLLYRCRQSKYSCFTRSIQSESHSPGSSTNHGVNQNETHEYNSLHPGDANLYESITQEEDTGTGQ
ncbi:unnamed protein product [Oreochromis niloticus]|nr:unnamed protein product [Mustela putorius furo]